MGMATAAATAEVLASILSAILRRLAADDGDTPVHEDLLCSFVFARLASIAAAERNEGIESSVWVSVNELEEWIADGRINDSFPIGAYIRVKLKGLI